MSAKSSSFSVEGNCDVSGAILLTPAMLEPYRGSEIMALRVALASKVNLDKVTLWLRHNLDGENLVEIEITSKTDPALAKGWIETPLPESYTIEDNEQLYLGMTYHQKAASKAFSLVGTGYENSFYANIGDGWKDFHSNGILSIEAIVEGEFSVDYDLALVSAVANLSIDPEMAVIDVNVANNGKNRVSGFNLCASYSDGEKYDKTYMLDILPGTKGNVEMRLPKRSDMFTNPLYIEITGVVDGEDIIKDNNRMQVEFPVVKKVFVEEYTTERCSNCPRVASYLHEVSHEDAYKDRIVVVCHHSGFFTDWLTQPIDEEILKFYNIGFAPAVTYDRYPYFEGNVANTPEKADLRKTFDAALAKPAGVKIAITPIYDEDGRKAIVTVNLDRTTLNISDPRLTVFLTEDNIDPKHQAGNDDKTHIHRHVIRAYNSTWGDPISWTGTNFTAVYEFDVEPDWKSENLRVVATVGNRNENDREDNIIDNAEEVNLLSAPASIPDMEVGEASVKDITYYDLAGRKVSAETEDLKIMVITMSDGNVETKKVF
ncbi:MAG: Omp28-related outer membrane protein [Muribaculaceae bacterium]|nr:Omp28-related outer membrane protein [Muribaculaceae bacterium]